MEIEESNLIWFLNLKKDQILAHISSSLVNFQSSEQSKLKALRQLSSYLYLINGKLEFEQFDRVFKMLVKAYVIHRENPQFSTEIFRCSGLLSLTLPLDDLVEQISVMLEKESSVDSLMSLSSTLCLFEKITSNSKPLIKNSQRMIETILSTFLKLETRIYENPIQLTRNAFLILLNLLSKEFTLHFNDSGHRLVCKVLILLKTSFSKNEIFTDEEFDHLIEKFSHKTATKKNQFLSLTMILFVNDIFESREFEKWNEYSPTRKQFVGLVENFPYIAILNYHKVLLILNTGCQVDGDPITRFESLQALEKTISIQEGTYADSEIIKSSTQFIFLEIIKKALVWKVGKPNLKIRRAGILCGIRLLLTKQENKTELNSCLAVLIPCVKSCLSDDHDSDLRLMSLEFLKLVFVSLKQIAEQRDLGEIYNSILERLDDAQDHIRINSVATFEALVLCDKSDFSVSLMEYILKVFFIHFDDSNEDLQNAIYETLLKISEKIGKEVLLETAKKNLGRLRYPEKCALLVRKLEENL